MSNEKKLHSRLERLMAGLGGIARDGLPRPVPLEPEITASAAGPGAPIDPHGVVPGWTWETDTHGLYTACSAEVTGLLGFDPAGLIGQPLTQVALPADSAGRRELATALQSQRPLLDLRLEAHAPDGSDRVVILNAMPLFDAADQFQGYRGVANVISELTDLPAIARPAPAPRPPLATPRPTAAPTTARPTSPADPLPARSAPPPTPAPALPQATPPLAATPAPNGRAPAVFSPGRLASWGYLSSADGLAPLGEWTAPEVDEALARGAPVIRSAPPDATGEALPGRALAVPIQLQNQTIGVLDFFDEGEAAAWSEDDVALVKAVSDQLALALENARLFDETRDYLNKQTLLYEVTRAAASAASLGDALNGAATALGRVLPEANIAILLLDPAGRALHIRAAVGFPPDLADRFSLPAGVGITGWVAAHNQPLLIPDVRLDPRYVAGLAGVLSEAAVPLALGERVIGVLNVESPRAGAFEEPDLQLLSTLAGTLTAIIVNNNLLEEISRERERLSVLYDVLQSLITRPDRQAIYETALNMAPRLGGQHAYLLLLGEREADATFLSTLPGLEALDPRQANAYALTIASQGLERWVLENGRSAVVPDTRADERWYTSPEHGLQAPARAVISVPLQTQRGGPRGVLAYTHSLPGALGEEHLPLIESLARQVAVALENEGLRQVQRVQSENAQALARAAQAMTRTLNEAELHQIIVEQVFEAFHADGAVLLRWIASNNTFLPVAVEVADRETQNLADRQSWPVLGQAFSATQRPDLLDSVENRRGRIVPLREEAGGHLRESMTMPLFYGGDVEGVVEVVQTGPIGGLGQADQELLQAILTAAASALQSARLYELQRQTAERLAEVDRLKSQFLANMSHELRTPLNSIIGFSRVILKGIDGPLTDLQSQDLTSINNAGQHLLGLINDILDMARIEAGKMELVLDEVDLHDTINGVMSTTVALVKDRSIKLIQDVAPDLPRVRADSMRVRQVLLNLLANAAKFTEAGSITLRARPVEAVGPYSGRLEPFVEIAILDTGSGIAPDDMVKLFEPFSQVDASATRKVGGTGLGLSICRQLVELHNGRIWAESELGKGSAFIFILPVSQPEPAVPEPPEPAVGASDRVVLAVDDDPGLVGLYRRYLEPHGYRVVGVSRSGEAITRAAELRPLVILLDVLMPNKDGWQVLTELKRSDLTRDIPVIMCTLVTEPDRAFELGAADYLTKPILEADLLRALGRLPAPADSPAASSAAAAAQAVPASQAEPAPQAAAADGHAAEQPVGEDRAA